MAADVLMLAHAGQAVAPHDLATAWNADPVVLALLLAALLLHHRGRGRSPERRRTVAFHVALGAIAIALLSPVEAAAGSLFSAHMLQHDLLLLVAAPLLVLARPGARLLRALPGRGRRAVGRTRRGLRVGATHRRVLHHPVTGVLALVVVLWSWHAGALYAAALQSELVHVLEHTTMLAGGWLFWTAVAAAVRAQRHATAVGMLFLAGLQGVWLGMLLLFSEGAWYPAYADSVAVFGLTPAADQQVAGLLLWLPASLLYVGTAACVVVRALSDDDGSAVTADPEPVRSPVS